MTSLIERLWNHSSVRFARTVAKDLWKSIQIIGSLEIVWWLLKRVEFMGYPAERLNYFERVHFCSALASFVLISVAFVIKLGRTAFKEEGA